MTTREQLNSDTTTMVRYDYTVDIKSPKTQFDSVKLANPAPLALEGNNVIASFQVGGLNSLAGPRTIDWTVRQGTTPVLTAKTVCSGAEAGDTCTNTSNNAAALDLVVQNAFVARLNLNFPGSAATTYNVIGKISYPANAQLLRPTAVTRNISSKAFTLPALPPAAAITTTVASIALNQAVQFDTTGSVFPVGSKLYFSTTAGTSNATRLTPIGFAYGDVVSNPRFTFTRAVDSLDMIIALSDGSRITKTINIKSKFTPVTGGSS